MAEKELGMQYCGRSASLPSPTGLCERLGIGPRDVLELSLDGDTLMAKPTKKAALEAFKEIRQAFERSGITEDELQKAGRRAR